VGTKIQSQGSPCGICGRQSGTTGFYLSTLVSTSHYYTTNTPKTRNHRPL